MFGGRNANEKAAASQATALFQNYYPEMLVRIDTLRSLNCPVLIR